MCIFAAILFFVNTPVSLLQYAYHTLMRVTLNHILPAARKGGYAIGAFNINNLEMCQGIVSAAIESHSPVIIQTSEGALQYAGMEYLAAIAWVAMESTDTPVVFHLDHGKNQDLVKLAIKTGFYSSVMYDGSSLPLKENIRTTREIVKLAHKKGMSVEAELGPIPGKEDLVDVKNGDAFFTDPGQAAQFVEETGCDALALSIGTAHGAFKQSATTGKLDLKRLAAIADAVTIPLVLHGASHVNTKLAKKLGLSKAGGISSADIKKAIALGISKINIDTDLRMAFTASLRSTINKNVREIDPRRLLGPSREAVKKAVKEKMKMFGCAGIA